MNNIQENIVRVRFAPSPTGHLHVGSLRAALFNWLFARHNNGVFLVRIEDTDLERSKPEYTKSILDSLKWVEIEPDEPIVIQSQRIDIHKKVVQKLLNENKAYKCFCTTEELEKRLGIQCSHSETFVKYDGLCRERQKQYDDLNKSFVVRFKIPDNQKEISFNDLIRGQVVFEKDQFDDFIILRSDGTPTYNFVVVVDDADMKITHVIRGEDHISNTPKQILLYQACEYKIPLFGHIPLILGPEGNKLSKRDAAISVIEYKNAGFLPDAFCNYLVRLGWSHGNQEIFTREELIKYFTIENVGKKGSIFDIKKLEWINAFYIRHKSAKELIDQIISSVDRNFITKITKWNKDQLYYCIDLFKERTRTLKELVNEIYELQDGPQNFDNEDIKPFIVESNLKILKEITTILSNQEIFESTELSKLIKNLAKKLKLPLPDLAKPLRVALTGKTSSPGVFDLLALLEKEESIKRLKFFIKYCEKVLTINF